MATWWAAEEAAEGGVGGTADVPAQVVSYSEERHFCLERVMICYLKLRAISVRDVPKC